MATRLNFKSSLLLKRNSKSNVLNQKEEDLNVYNEDEDDKLKRVFNRIQELYRL